MEQYIINHYTSHGHGASKNLGVSKKSAIEFTFNCLAVYRAPQRHKIFLLLSRFAPGRGNLKILVLSANGDAVSIWDVKSDLELVAEVRAGKDTLAAKVMDIDWAASDRQVYTYTAAQ